MARHELLESILKAQFDLEYAELKDLPGCLERLNTLLDQAIAGTHLTRRELLLALRDRYQGVQTGASSGRGQTTVGVTGHGSSLSTAFLLRGAV